MPYSCLLRTQESTRYYTATLVPLTSTEQLLRDRQHLTLLRTPRAMRTPDGKPYGLINASMHRRKKKAHIENTDNLAVDTILATDQNCHLKLLDAIDAHFTEYFLIAPSRSEFSSFRACGF